MFAACSNESSPCETASTNHFSTASKSCRTTIPDGISSTATTIMPTLPRRLWVPIEFSRPNHIDFSVPKTATVHFHLPSQVGKPRRTNFSTRLPEIDTAYVCQPGLKLDNTSSSQQILLRQLADYVDPARPPVPPKTGTGQPFQPSDQVISTLHMRRSIRPTAIAIEIVHFGEHRLGKNRPVHSHRSTRQRAQAGRCFCRICESFAAPNGERFCQRRMPSLRQPSECSIATAAETGPPNHEMKTISPVPSTHQTRPRFSRRPN